MKKIIVLSCLFLVLLSLISAGKKNEKDPVVSSYILIESNTKTVLEEYNSCKRLNAGYLNKLMALLIIAEDIAAGEYTLDAELTASQSVSGIKGSVVWLEPGDKMNVEELLKSVIIGNANDALIVLAECSAGSVDEFVMEMNSRAFELGLRDTAYFSPYGYFDEREYTTAYDIAIICSELLKYDFLQPYFKIWRDFVRNGTVELVNENTLSRTYQYHFGFKSAHSEESGYCIAECGKNEEGTAFISVVLNAESDDDSFKKAKQLLNNGFSNYKVTDSYFPDEMIKPIRVKNGEESAVELILAKQGSIVVPRGTNSLRIVCVFPEYLNAPVKNGQKVGTAVFYNGKKIVFETDVIIKNDVKKISLGFVLEKILLNMTK